MQSRGDRSINDTHGQRQDSYEMRPSKLNVQERQKELYADSRAYDADQMCPAKDEEGRDLGGRPMYSVE